MFFSRFLRTIILPSIKPMAYFAMDRLQNDHQCTKLQAGLSKKSNQTPLALQSKTKSMCGLYVVEKIVGKRIQDKKNVQYKVKWKNYDSSQNTWEPVKNLKNVQQMVKEFQMRNKDKLLVFQAAKTEKKDKILSSTIINKYDRRNSSRKLAFVKVDEDLKAQKKQADRIIKKVLTRTSNQQATVIPESEEDDKQFNEQTKDQDEKLRKQIVSLPISQELVGLQLNIDSIAAKIVSAFEQKNSSYKIIGIEKPEKGTSDLYLVEDAEGNKQYKQRQFVLKYLSPQLISYYQKELQLIN